MGLSHQKKTLKELALNIISNIACQIFFVLFTTIGTSIVSAITLYRKSNGNNIDSSWWILFGLFIILSIGNIIASIFLFIKRNNKPTFPAFKSDVSYNFIRTELYFTDREHIKCNREVGFKVLCDKMRFIRKQFTWTGDGYKGTVLDENTKKKNYKIDDSVRRHPPQIYDIEFDSEKKKGDYVSYRITSEVEDCSHVMQPFVSQQILQTTKKLTLILTVPMELVKNVYSAVYADTSCKNKIVEPQNIEPKIYGDIETYEIVIKKPNLLHIYRIEWEWNN